MLPLPAMKTWMLALVLTAAACGETGDGPLRQVSIESPAAIGLSLRELPPQALRALGLSYGLSVTKAGSLCERAGLRVGDVVYAVNDHRIASLEDFTRMVARHTGRLALLVRRGATDYYVPMDLGPAPVPRLPGRGPRDTLLRT